MWNDLWRVLEYPPYYPSLLRASRLCVEGYSPQGVVSIPPSARGAVRLHDPWYPYGYWWTENGLQVVVVNGTTSLPDEGSRQMAGWLLPHTVAGGQANSFYSNVADNYVARVANAKTLFIGHSMGGGIAHEMYRNFKVRYPLTECGALSFGAPASSSDAASTSLHKDFNVAIRTDNDAIAWLPGSQAPGPVWQRAGRSYTLEKNGNLTGPYNMPPSSLAAFSAIVESEGLVGHSTANYFQRLAIHVSPAHNPWRVMAAWDP